MHGSGTVRVLSMAWEITQAEERAEKKWSKKFQALLLLPFSANVFFLFLVEHVWRWLVRLAVGVADEL